MGEKRSLLLILLITCLTGFSQVQIPSKYSNKIDKKSDKEVLTDVADLISYLASDESSFLAGLNVDINGGLYFS